MAPLPTKSSTKREIPFFPKEKAPVEKHRRNQKETWTLERAQVFSFRQKERANTARKNFFTGHKVERYVAFILFFKGYRLLSHNFKYYRGTGTGETDLILKKGKTLVFAEVKKRESFEKAAFAISPFSQKRLVKSAEIFLQSRPELQNYDIRFDAVLVNRFFFIRHILNAFEKKE